MIKGRGGLIAVLVGAMCVSTFQLFALAVLAKPLIDEFDISRTQIGFLGAGNTAVGAMIAPTLGRVTDRIGARLSVILLSVVSALGLFATALAPAYWTLLCASVIAGFPQGWSNSATNNIVDVRLPVGERGTITGLKQSGVQFAIFLAGLTLPFGTSQIGWRQSLAVYGGVALAVGLFAALTLSDDRPAETEPPSLLAADSPATSDAAAPVGAKRLPGFVYRVAIYALFLGLAAGGISRFLPLFANEVMGFSETRAGLVVALAGLLGMIARVIWGQIADTMMAPRRALFILACGSAATALLVFFATTLGGWVLWVVAIGSAFFLGAWNVVAMLAVMTSVAADQAGRGTGIVMLFFLSGLTLSAPAVGWSADVTGDYQTAWGIIICLALAGAATMFQRPRSAA